jgi:hypothetical protein
VQLLRGPTAHVATCSWRVQQSEFHLVALACLPHQQLVRHRAATTAGSVRRGRRSLQVHKAPQANVSEPLISGRHTFDVVSGSAIRGCAVASVERNFAWQDELPRGSPRKWNSPPGPLSRPSPPSSEPHSYLIYFCRVFGAFSSVRSAVRLAALQLECCVVTRPAAGSFRPGLVTAICELASPRALSPPVC